MALLKMLHNARSDMADRAATLSMVIKRLKQKISSFSLSKRNTLLFNEILNHLKEEDWYSALDKLSQIPLNAERKWRLLLADALIYAGNIAQAKKQFYMLALSNDRDEQAIAGVLQTAYWLEDQVEVEKWLEIAQHNFSEAPWLTSFLFLKNNKGFSLPEENESSNITDHSIGLNNFPDLESVEKPREDTPLIGWLRYGDALYWGGATSEALAFYRLALLKFPAAHLLFWRLFFLDPIEFPLATFDPILMETIRKRKVISALILIRIKYLLNPEDLFTIKLYLLLSFYIYDYPTVYKLLEPIHKPQEIWVKYINLVSAYFFEKRYDEVIEVTTKMMEQHPDSWIPYIHLMRLELLKGNYELAKLYMKQIHSKKNEHYTKKSKMTVQEQLKKVPILNQKLPHDLFLQLVKNGLSTRAKGPSLRERVNFGDALVYVNQLEDAKAIYKAILSEMPYLIPIQKRLAFLEEKDFIQLFSQRDDVRGVRDDVGRTRLWRDYLLKQTKHQVKHTFSPTLFLSVRFSGYTYVCEMLKKAGIVPSNQGGIMFDYCFPTDIDIPEGYLLFGHLDYAKDSFVNNLEFLKFSQNKKLKKYCIFRHPLDVRLSAWSREIRREKPDISWKELFENHFNEMERCILSSIPKYDDLMFYYENPDFQAIRFETIHLDPMKFFADFLTDINAAHLIPNVAAVIEPPQTPAFQYKQFLHIPKFRAFLNHLPESYVRYIERMGYQLELQ